MDFQKGPAVNKSGSGYATDLISRLFTSPKIYPDFVEKSKIQVSPINPVNSTNLKIKNPLIFR